MTTSAISRRLVSYHWPEQLNAALEKHFWFCSAVLVALMLANACIGDIRNKLWTDEIYTLYMAHQSSPNEIVKATIEGSDGAPPFYAMIVHAILPLVRNAPFAERLPSTLGYCGMVLCLLAFCRPRFPAVYSFIAVLFAYSISSTYLTEGRGYGLEMFCAAAGLLCWQASADDKRGRLNIVLLAVCLALMTALHYYAIFFAFALFLAELARWRWSGKPNFLVLVALTAVPLILALHYPFIVASRPFQKHFWSPAKWGNISEAYSAYLRTCVPLFALLAIFSNIPERRNGKQVTLTVPEWAAAVSLLLLPFFVIVLSIYTTHVFVDRYILWAVPGIAVLVAALLCLAARGKIVAGVCTMCLLLAFLALRDTYMLLKKPLLRHGQAVSQELLSLQGGSEPIVVADEHVYLELSYYASQAIRERLIFPVNRDLDLRYIGADTGALLLSALRHRTKLHIMPYEDLQAEYPHFILAAMPGHYLPGQLLRTGYRVVPIDHSTVPILFEVEAPGSKVETVR